MNLLTHQDQIDHQPLFVLMLKNHFKKELFSLKDFTKIISFKSVLGDLFSTLYTLLNRGDLLSFLYINTMLAVGKSFI
jgi:hypothetical protein